MALRAFTAKQRERETMTTTTPSTAPAQPKEAGVLEHLDPTALVIETNVRTEALILEAEFVDSVRMHGVLVPVLGWRATDGFVHVRAGQRRTLAAREAALTAIPVYVVRADDDSMARRIVEQLIENEHRQHLTDTDRVTAWQQLTLEGLTVATIAKRTGTKRDQVAAGLAVAASSTGGALLGEGALTLDQAAALVEFEDDTEVLADLTSTAEQDPDYLPVAIQRARNERATRDAIRAAETAEAALGHRILSSNPGWSEAPYALDRLSASDGGAVEPDAVRGKPGVAVRVTTSWQGEIVVRYYLDDPEAFGLTRPQVSSLPMGVGRQEGPMSEEAKAERRTLIARNKEWDAATTVRTEWLTTFLSRKALPKNATAVLAASLTGAHGLVADSMSHGSSTAKTLLGIDPGYGTRLDAYLQQHPTRALHVALAVALGGIEQTLTRNTWRAPSPVTATYLATLAEWGYPLCPVERIAGLLDVTEPSKHDAGGRAVEAIDMAGGQPQQAAAQ
jgi:ParB family chromosome partitioning protein